MFSGDTSCRNADGCRIRWRTFFRDWKPALTRCLVKSLTAVSRKFSIQRAQLTLLAQLRPSANVSIPSSRAFQILYRAMSAWKRRNSNRILLAFQHDLPLPSLRSRCPPARQQYRNILCIASRGRCFRRAILHYKFEHAKTHPLL